MSTLTSTDMGELKRPSTRVHAPPGGGSNWSFGDDTNGAVSGATSSPGKFKSKRGGNAKSNVTSANSPFATPPPAPVSSAAPVSRTATPASATANTAKPAAVQRVARKSTINSIRVAVIKTSDGNLTEQFYNNFITRASDNSLLTIESFIVPAINDLPYAANKLASFGDFHAIMCLGFLSTRDETYQFRAGTVFQALTEISVRTVKPIIQAVFVGKNEIATSLANSGWGSEHVDTIENLVNLGGFVGIPEVTQSLYKHHKAPVKSVPLSKGNVLPESIASAPKPVAHSLELLRSSLFEHGARGIVGLARKFRIMDDDGSKTIDIYEFKKAIAEHALDLCQKEILDLFNYLDEDKSGNISYNEFLVAVRGELNDRRTQLVLMAFVILDNNHNGVIELDDIVAKYKADQHPDVLSGHKTKNEIFREFLDTFDGGEKDGKVHVEEFVRYYTNVSASIDEDDYFELMIRNAWHISGGEGWCENSTCKRVLITHADGSQTVEEIKNDIGIDPKDYADKLKKQGVEATSIAKSSSLDTRDGNKSTGAKKDSFQPRYPSKKQHGAGESSIVFG